MEMCLSWLFLQRCKKRECSQWARPARCPPVRGRPARAGPISAQAAWALGSPVTTHHVLSGSPNLENTELCLHRGPIVARLGPIGEPKSATKLRVV